MTLGPTTRCGLLGVAGSPSPPSNAVSHLWPGLAPPRTVLVLMLPRSCPGWVFPLPTALGPPCGPQPSPWQPMPTQPLPPATQTEQHLPAMCSRLVAQIHDELLFEVGDAQVPEFAGEPRVAQAAFIP